jgi:hypothetical protein
MAGAGRVFSLVLIELDDFAMMRRMLFGIEERAEGAGPHGRLPLISGAVGGIEPSASPMLDCHALRASSVSGLPAGASRDGTW